MKKETYLKELKKCDSGTECFIVAKAYIKSLEKQLEAVKELIKENHKDIILLEENKSFDEKLKAQSVSVLSNQTLRLEMIMEIK